MKKFGKTSGAVALGLGLAAAAPFAVAQQAPDAVMEKIEITGSFIRRADAETPSPVQVISGEDMKRAGFTSISEALTSITANNNGALTQSFGGAFAQGAAGVSLRGLSVGSTLVLIDGHRMAPYPISDDGQRNFVDISSIPFDVVERVEILKDGASAIYGSDAMAGVVNVILKKSFKGLTISGENGWTHRGGGQSSHLAGTLGFGDLADDGQNAFVSLEYRHQDPINLEQRPYINQLDWSALGGQNLVPGGNNTGYSQSPRSNTGYFRNPALPAGYANYGWLPGCSAAAATANQCEYAHPWDKLVPESQNLNLLARITRNLGSGWTGTFTGSFFQSDTTVENRPFATGNYTLSGVSPGPGSLTNVTVFAPGNMLAPVPASLAAQLGVTAGTLLPIRVNTRDLGQQNTAIENDSYRFVGDLKGTLGAWDVDATYGWTQIVQHATQTGTPIYSVLIADLANGTYVPNGNNSAAVLNSIAPAVRDNYASTLWFTGIHGGRELFSLPGGKAAISTGADFYYHAVNFVPSNIETSARQAPNFAYAIGTQSDWSLYAELAAPILKTLEVDAAVRHDHVNTYGNNTTPKIGFKFTPVTQVAVRGTYSRGFRAPNSVESNNSAAAGYAFNFADPLLCGNPGGATGVGNYPDQCSVPAVFTTSANPALQPEKSTSKTFGVILEPVKWASFSADYYDIKIDNLIISGSVDPNLPSTTVRGAPVSQTYNSPTGPINQTPAVGDFLYYATLYTNLGYIETKGFEYELRNNFDLGAAGKIHTDLMWTLLSSYVLAIPGSPTVELVGTHGPTQISADTGTPRNKAKFSLTWEKGPYEVTTTVNYVGGFGVDDPSYGQYTCDQAIGAATQYHGSAFFPANGQPGSFCHVSSYTDVDLYGSWQVDKHWQLHGSVSNLFDREAPQDAQTYAIPNLNTAFHMNGAIGRAFLVGATYKF